MAKKVRRVKKKKQAAPDAEIVVESTAEDIGVQAASADKETAKEKAASAKEKSEESFRDEYAYVVKDLRRVLLVSGAMFLLLIVLNLLLQ